MYLYPITLCNISQNAMGQPGGGTLPGPAGGGGGTLAGVGGGTELGQHREYLLHGGRYASCVHAGGLSCSIATFTNSTKDIGCRLSTEQLNKLDFLTSRSNGRQKLLH